MSNVNEITRQLLVALPKMRMAGLKEFGKLWQTVPELRAMADVWAECLERRKVRAETILAATNSIIDGGGEFPTVAQFAEACLSAQFGMFDTVGVPVMIDGVECLAMILVPVTVPVAERSKRAFAIARHRGLPVHEPSPALPMTREEFVAAADRLTEKLGARKPSKYATDADRLDSIRNRN